MIASGTPMDIDDPPDSDGLDPVGDDAPSICQLENLIQQAISNPTQETELLDGDEADPEEDSSGDESDPNMDSDGDSNDDFGPEDGEGVGEDNGDGDTGYDSL